MHSALALLLLALALPGAAPGAPAPADPAPPLEPSKRYSFEEALQRALARNPSAAVAEQEVRRAEALVRQAMASWLPTLTGNAVGQRLDGERRLQERVVQGAWSLSANVNLAVPLVAASRWAGWWRAKDQAETARMSVQDVRRSLSLATARAYLAVIAQRRVLEASDRAFRTAKAHYEFAHGRRLGGVGNRLDEVRAEQEEEATRAQAELARSSLARAQEALGVLLAEDGPVDAAADARLPEAPELEPALSDAAERRADVSVLEARRSAATNAAANSYTDYLPLLAGQFQPFYQNPSTLTQPETGWQAQLILTLPFYDGGLRYGLKRERQAVQTQTELALEGALRQVHAEVRGAFEVLRRADQALGAAQRSARLAREALDLATQAYAAGATTNLEVIDAERRARDAETGAAVAEDAARQARLDLLAASGRFP